MPHQSDQSNKVGILFKNLKVEGPVKLLSCQGVIGRPKEDEISIHLHTVVSDKENKIYGGHIIPERCPVLDTGEIMIQESSDTQIMLKQDEEVGGALHKYYSHVNQ